MADGGVSAEQFQGFVVAEDDNLTAVADRVITAPGDFAGEGVAPDDLVHIPQTASDDTALTRRFGAENALHPKVWRKACLSHMPKIARIG